MWFVYIHVVWFILWLRAEPFKDVFPYGLLTMIVSLEAIFLSTFVMISQNRAPGDEAGGARAGGGRLAWLIVRLAVCSVTRNSGGHRGPPGGRPYGALRGSLLSVQCEPNGRAGSRHAMASVTSMLLDALNRAHGVRSPNTATTCRRCATGH